MTACIYCGDNIERGMLSWINHDRVCKNKPSILNTHSKPRQVTLFTGIDGAKKIKEILEKIYE